MTQLFTYLLTHKLFSSFIRRYLVSRACHWVMPALSALLRTFSFHFSLLFFHVGSQAAAASYVVYPISDIGRCRKCWKYVSCTRWSAMEKDFELILTVKMETRHPVGEHLVVNFRRSVIDAWLWRPEVAGPGNFVSNFCVLGKKRPLTVIFFKFCSESFHRLTESTVLCSIVVKFIRREIGEIVRYLPDK